jgi:nucleoside-diphosphate-sugar epimerase
MEGPGVSKKVLVTGGSGFLGSSLVKGLLARGFTVRVLDDDSRGHPRRLESVKDHVEILRGDVRDPAAVYAATRGVDVVAHLAFVNGTEFFYSKPELVLDVGVKGAMHTIDAALEHGVPEYWLMSSSEVYQTPPSVPTDERVPLIVPDPLNPRYSYGGGKIISELLAINYGRAHFERTVIVRPHNVYGPDMGWEHVIPQLALRARDQVARHPSGAVPMPIQGDGTQTRAFVYVDDFTEGCLLAFLGAPERVGIYHVGTNDERTIADVARAVVGYFGREADIQPSELPRGGTLRRVPDITKVSTLGYRPQVSFEEGLARTVPWYLEHAALAPKA